MTHSRIDWVPAVVVIVPRSAGWSGHAMSTGWKAVVSSRTADRPAVSDSTWRTVPIETIAPSG
ncbi:hypothetical protein QEH68_22015 (plasmid) [Paenarthrobacter sp. OM7]|uniref:hypothetical protein n=1 Tax=Paenarthrobacter sp. OM7 TaxID=3041264 RepID=UPI0024695F3B|nr:hypothetical protein [Paenarthrobacter sp. OM7]WGM22942.1 hypothetical protein QEH68_22015 [Paenarthrobacter sp. OM7]